MKRYVPLEEAERVAQKVVEAIRPYCKLIEVCGSIRRRKPIVGDVDIVLVPENGDGLLTALEELTGTQINLKGQFEVDGVQVDLFIVKEEGWGAACMYATGAAETNIAQRALAKRKGMLLNQYGLYDRATGRFIAGRTEEEVYEALGLEFLPPERR